MDGLFDLVKPAHLCTPVDKNGEGIKNETAHLMCYSARSSTGPAINVHRRGIRINNQFGPNKLVATHAHELCVPSTKELQ